MDTVETTWHIWNGSTRTTTTSLWEYWLDNCTSSTATTTNNIIYYKWHEAQQEYRLANPYVFTRKITEEERRKQEQAERDYQKRIEQEKRRRQKAEDTAEELLLANLTKEQRVMYLRMKKFHVISKTGKRFEIECKKRFQNIFELDEKGNKVKEFCIYQKGETPNQDNWLSQKLLLEADEATFRKIANQRVLVV